MNTFVYSYGAKPPVEGMGRIADQIGNAHRYYNKLIELRRAQYEATESVKATLCPELEAIEAAVSAADDAVDEMVSELRRRNAAARRKRATAQETGDIAAMKENRATLWAERKAIREQVAQDAAIQSALAEVYAEYQGKLIPGRDRRSGGHFKNARRDCGVYFGTYLEIEKSVEAAVTKTQGRPRFRRWTGDGLIAVQIQNGMTVEEVLGGTDTRFRIGPGIPRGKRAPLHIVSLRVGSEGRDPIWARVPVYLHRPLPADSVIMGAALVRRQVAVRRNSAGEWVPYYEWNLNVTLRTETTKRRATDGACGVDLGWRLMADGALRVAYVVGTDGRNEQITLPASLLARFRRCDDLQEIRDRLFNGAIAHLRWFVNTLTEVPEWLREAKRTAHSWRDKGRLARLLKDWQPVPGGGAVVHALRWWQFRDAHLWQYQEHNRRKALAIRRNLYRTIAAGVRERYATIAVEDCDWRQLMKLPDATDNTAVNRVARYNQRVSAVGMLRADLKASGAVMVATENTTRTCHACGVINGGDFADSLFHVCSGCEQVWDQDENAARILLARALVMNETAVSGGEPGNGVVASEVPAPPRGRWQRRKLDRSQKLMEGGVGA